MQQFANDSVQFILPLAKNNHEKAVILLMQQLQNPGKSLAILKEIYQLDPNYPDFKVLIQREINKLEDYLLTKPMTSNDPAAEGFGQIFDENGEMQKAENWAMDMKYAKDLGNFIEQVLNENKQKDKAFYHLAAAHIAFITQDYAHVNEHTAKAQQQNVPANLQTQLKLTGTLATIFKDKKISADAEPQILDLLKFLEKEQKNITDYKKLYSQLMLFLAQKYIEHKQIAQGILLLSRTEQFYGITGSTDLKNFYHHLLEIAQPKDYEAILELLNLTKKTPFQHFLTSNPKPYDASYFHDYVEDPKTKEYKEVNLNPDKGWDTNKIKDYWATYYINRDLLDSAYVVLQTIPDQYWKRMPYTKMLDCDPFYLDVDNAHANKPEVKTRYTKKTFVKRLLDLKKQAAKDPAKCAQNYYLLGNAYYNMTWHGNFWLMNRIWWSIGEMPSYADLTNEDGNSYYYTTTERNEFNNYYYGCDLAKKYYTAALQECKSSDTNLAALSTFMVNRCTKNYSIYEWSTQKHDEKAKFKPTSNKDESATAFLTKNFKDGAIIYEHLASSCPTYLDFVGKYSR